MKQRSFLAVILLLACVEQSQAHETWLSPGAFSAPVAQAIQFELTSGMKFPALEFGPSADRVSDARVRIGAKKFPLEVRAHEDAALRFEHTFMEAGRVTAWVTLSPKRLELDAAKVEEYFQEINASAQIRADWEQIKKHGWKETYTKCAKTCLTAGTPPANDFSWRKRAGMLLEIVPLTDPAALTSGGSATFQLLQKGRPLRNMALGVILEGDSQRHFETTDGNGRATFRIGKAGRALLFAVHLRRRAGKPEWESTFTTLTVNVAP